MVKVIRLSSLDVRIIAMFEMITKSEQKSETQQQDKLNYSIPPPVIKTRGRIPDSVYCTNSQKHERINTQLIRIYIQYQNVLEKRYKIAY